MTPRTALFPGTFDPVTRGHLDVVRRAASVFPRVVVAVAREGKATLLPLEERVALLVGETKAIGGVEVAAFSGLLVEFARSVGASVLVRGVRSYQDWEYELAMSRMNRHLAPDLETVFLVPSAEHAFVSSTLVREVAAHGGDVSGLVSPAVAAALARAAQKQR
jgi:pantetheine-phosphate adenylyltransferase